jgi:hypothetical protein
MMPDSTANQQAEQTVPDATRRKLDEQRIEFGKTVKGYFPILFVLTVVIAASLILLSALGFFMNRTMDATVIAASVQVAFGMVLGFVCVYIGLMMTWLGIDAAYSVKGDIGPGSFVLKSASPGLLFALGGMVLVSVSLHKEIVYEENSSNLVHTQPVNSKATRGAVVPESPKSLIRTPAEVSPSSQSPFPGREPPPDAAFPGQAPFNPAPSAATEPKDK